MYYMFGFSCNLDILLLVITIIALYFITDNNNATLNSLMKGPETVVSQQNMFPKIILLYIYIWPSYVKNKPMVKGLRHCVEYRYRKSSDAYPILQVF